MLKRDETPIKTLDTEAWVIFVIFFHIATADGRETIPEEDGSFIFRILPDVTL